MPDLLTPQTIASAGPLVIDTLLKHFLSHKSLKARSKARGDDLLYDEAFVLMKTFLESATKYPVASLQKFGQVRTPAPPAVAIHHISIPHRSLALSAEYLIKAFGGEEMAYKIAGGSKWWQVRAGAGLEAEWIVMKKDYREWERGEKGRKKSGAGAEGKRGSGSGPASGVGTPKGKEKAKVGVEKEETGESADDAGWRSEMDETRCMLYIHGGAYYWGSINTHRYTIWRYARKMRGRCFAVNYRKAPQYPFPCAIQDCLAAYLYLTRPPPGAPHRPVRPEHIIIAGDSAGGGLVLALLQILRDTEGLELPAGAVLISPWSDLTHSFPSILHNTSTDIVPPYSFIHKPSSLWPPPPPDLTNIVQSRLKSKIQQLTSHLHSHHAETSSPTTLSPSQSAAPHRPNAEHTSDADDGDSDDAQNPIQNIPLMGRPADLPEKLRSSQLGTKKKFSLNFGRGGADLHPTTHKGDAGHQPLPEGESGRNPSRANPADAYRRLEPRELRDKGGREDGGGVAGSGSVGGDTGKRGTGERGGATTEDGTATPKAPARGSTLAKCDYPVELTVQGEPVVIDTQIQLYATNAQLCYPLVSPVLGYMGGLCPLYVCCGDNEVLRDEIIYLAHKAANPGKYPIRDDVKAMMPHYEGIEERYGPTKVHLQVYDGTGHDLPLFSMCKSARGVFRAISTFARFVTPSASVMPTSTSTSSTSASASASAAGPGSGSAGKGFGGFSMTPYSLTRRSSTKATATPRSTGSSPRVGPADLVPAAAGSGDSRRASKVENTDLAPPLPLTAITELSISESPRTSLALSPITTTTTSTGTATASGSSGTGITSTLAGRSDSLHIQRDIPPSESPVPMSPLSRPTVDRSLSAVSSLTNTPTEEGQPGLASPLAPAPAPPADPAVGAGAGASGDDAGPRWGGFEDDHNNANEGEAGHPSVYRGPLAFKNNMIRERVDPNGHLRPLEPEDQLGAMTMPADEIGTIKEGPAMRYLTGQYLWDKRYKRARKEVERHRERNLRDARGKDRERIVRGVKGRYESHKARKAAEVEAEKGEKKGGPDVEGGEGAGEESEWEDRAEVEGEGNEEQDWSWDWAWALDGETPPPSAIVSRRDTTEARKLALMADRLDSSKPTHIGGLSIWVALATFFSNVGEKEKASEALKEAKAKKAGDGGRRQSDDSVDVGTDGEEVGGTTTGDEHENEAESRGSRTGTGVGEKRRGSSTLEKLGHAFGFK